MADRIHKLTGYKRLATSALTFALVYVRQSRPLTLGPTKTLKRFVAISALTQTNDPRGFAARTRGDPERTANPHRQAIRAGLLTISVSGLGSGIGRRLHVSRKAGFARYVAAYYCARARTGKSGARRTPQ